MFLVLRFKSQFYDGIWKITGKSMKGRARRLECIIVLLITVITRLILRINIFRPFPFAGNQELGGTQIQRFQDQLVPRGLMTGQ